MNEPHIHTVNPTGSIHLLRHKGERPIKVQNVPRSSAIVAASEAGIFLQCVFRDLSCCHVRVSHHFHCHSSHFKV